MFGTVILDAFEATQSRAVADAIEYLCAPDEDSFGWASAGVYAFFNPQTKELLYVGMTKDLTTRFEQHTGLRACKPRCCKYEKVQAYFQQHAKLGLAILLQSPIEQPDIPRTRDARAGAEEVEHDENQRGIANAFHAESALLTTYSAVAGALPPWNGVPGQKQGRVPAMTRGAIQFMGHPDAVRAMSGHDVPDIVARRPLRDLCKDSVAEGNEEYLHGARMFVVNGGMTLVEAIGLLQRRGAVRNIPTGYLQSVLVL